MQFSQKKIINIAIVIAISALLLIPTVALFKSFFKEQEEEEVMIPQIIERDEIVEEIEYITAPTVVPATVQTSVPSIQPILKREAEIEDEDDD